MKTNFRITLIVWLFSVIVFSGCEKAVVYNGNVNVVLQYHQRPVPDIPVYYYAGIPLKDCSGNTRYQSMQISAADGSATFRQLTPGPYHFTASGFLKETNKMMRADTDITVRKRYRDESNYQIGLSFVEFRQSLNG
ncbi:hypothetical protein [Mucilaginibacter sp.]|uniref:hypothetical protein n=1 Tax=Mucilaginibacter sp. TaxID=1882438 RepID=UPI00356A8E1E